MKRLLPTIAQCENKPGMHKLLTLASALGALLLVSCTSKDGAPSSASLVDSKASSAVAADKEAAQSSSAPSGSPNHKSTNAATPTTPKADKREKQSSTTIPSTQDEELARKATVLSLLGQRSGVSFESIASSDSSLGGVGDIDSALTTFGEERDRGKERVPYSSLLSMRHIERSGHISKSSARYTINVPRSYRETVWLSATETKEVETGSELCSTDRDCQRHFDLGPLMASFTMSPQNRRINDSSSFTCSTDGMDCHHFKRKTGESITNLEYERFVMASKDEGIKCHGSAMVVGKEDIKTATKLLIRVCESMKVTPDQ